MRIVQVVGYNLLDSVCDECPKIADWRIRNPDTGLPMYAACKSHKDMVRQRAYHELYGDPLPESHPDAIDAEVTRMELRKEGY